MNELVERQQQRGKAPVQMGYGSVEAYELLARAAKSLSTSTLVPEAYRFYKLNKEGSVTGENPQAIANCMLALNMAVRMRADPLMVMQNLYMIEGRPSWSSVWIIASINQCGRFTPLRFDMTEEGPPRAVEYETFEWTDGANGRRQKTSKNASVTIRDRSCFAWALERATNERLTSPKISMEMAVREGWLQRNGSKWQTMPEVMLRYRAASFFGKLYAPELLMGLPSADEVFDAHETATGEWEVQQQIMSPQARPDWPEAGPIFIDEIKSTDAVTTTAVVDTADLGPGTVQSGAPPPPPPRSQLAGLITPTALTILRKHLSDLWPGEELPMEFCKRFEIESPEALPMAKVNDAFGWLTDQKKAKAAA